MILEVIGFIMLGAGAGAITEKMKADRRRKEAEEREEKIKKLKEDLWHERRLKDKYEPYRDKYYDAYNRIEKLNREKAILSENSDYWENEVKEQRELLKKMSNQEYKGKKIGEIFKENDKLRCISERYAANLTRQIKNCKYGLTVSEGSEYTRLLIELEAFNRLKSLIDKQIPKEYKED